MEFHVLPIFAFVSVVLIGVSHAALPSEVYWKKMLPYTAMPSAVTDALHPEWLEEKTSVSFDGVGYAALGVHTGNGGGKINIYAAAASETQLKSDPATALFFLQKDLKAGTQMTLQLTTHPKNDAVFLSQEAADAIPFSSDKLPAILSWFSIDPNSVEAAIMKETVKECERKAIKGEDKYCATSLESMVDYAASKLGKKVEAVSNDVGKEEKKDKYTITGVKRIDVGGQAVACHKENYAYAVFYCHTIESTEAYELELAGEGGGKVKATAVCHLDTAAWNPKHLAFQVLGVKPGSVPVCHFLQEDAIVWVHSG